MVSTCNETQYSFKWTQTLSFSSSSSSRNDEMLYLLEHLNMRSSAMMQWWWADGDEEEDVSSRRWQVVRTSRLQTHTKRHVCNINRVHVYGLFSIIIIWFWCYALYNWNDIMFIIATTITTTPAFSALRVWRFYSSQLVMAT